MKQRAVVLAAAVLIVAMMLSACSSGGGGGTVPVATQTKSKGVITGFGSVIVNGVEYDSAGASVSIDGVSSPESDLQVGMVVTVSGSKSSAMRGSASTIEAADALEGPVSGLFSGPSSTLEVMGQIVKVDGATIYQNISGAAALAVNDMVEVSGFPDGSGVILATRIEKKATVFTAGTTTVEIKGPVSGLTGSVFTINALTVDASGVTLPAGLANGSRVEVRGTLAAAGGPMTATFLEIEPGFSASEGEHVELEGIVTDFVSMSNFKVNGVQVDASALTGVTFANGMKVEIEGTMVGGVLVAAGTSEVEHESYLLLEGNVSAVNPATGVISLLAVTVHTTAATELRDSSAADIRMFGLSDIAVNDHVEIGGYQDAGGTIIATRLERKDASAQLAIQGLVTAATTATSLTILGLTVDTSATPANHFIDIDGTPYASAADFFAAVTLNKTVVKATGTAFSGTTLTATEVEIEKQLP